jgi:hypothetical protein
MVWNLLLAHFLGDFVLQNDWMVRNRDKLWVLTLHGVIHFVLMFLLVGQPRSVIWPYLLLIALIHISQDRIKNNLTNKRPNWIGVAFIIDQVLHYAAIWVIAGWLQRLVGSFSLLEKPIWVMVAIVYLFVTYVWFISERVLNLSNTDYIQSVNNTKFARMLTRGGLISLFLLVRTWTASGLAIVLSNPYPTSKFRQRALLTDVSVSLLAMIFLFWALG